MRKKVSCFFCHFIFFFSVLRIFFSFTSLFPIYLLILRFFFDSTPICFISFICTSLHLFFYALPCFDYSHIFPNFFTIFINFISIIFIFLLLFIFSPFNLLIFPIFPTFLISTICWYFPFFPTFLISTIFLDFSFSYSFSWIHGFFYSQLKKNTTKRKLEKFHGTIQFTIIISQAI